MVNYNEGGPNSDRKEVGADCTLFLPEGTEVPVTNVSFTEEANTSEVQFTDGFHQSIAVTGVTYSGSFEIAGNADDERDVTWSDGNGANDTSLPQYVATMTIQDGDRNWSFSSVLINSHNKDIPADDRVTHSFDFMAEKLIDEPTL